MKCKDCMWESICDESEYFYNNCNECGYFCTLINDRKYIPSRDEYLKDYYDYIEDRNS